MSASPAFLQGGRKHERQRTAIGILTSRRTVPGTQARPKWTLCAQAIGVLAVVIAVLTSEASAETRDMTGAWVTDATTCKQVFKGSSGGLPFAEDADVYGSGFVYEKNRLVGKNATCTIKGHKEDGDVLHVITSCSTDVALATVIFSLKVEDDDRIVRVFPGVPELNTRYFRCKQSQ